MLKPAGKLLYRSFVSQMKIILQPSRGPKVAEQQESAALELNSLVIKINNSNNYNPSHF